MDFPINDEVYLTIKDFLLQINFGTRVDFFIQGEIFSWFFNTNVIFFIGFLFWSIVYLFIMLLFYIFEPLKK